MLAIGFFLSPVVVVNVVVAALVVYAGRRNPGVTWAWLFVILMLPYVGVVLYMLLGFDGRRHNAFTKKRVQDGIYYQEFLLMSGRPLQGSLPDLPPAEDIIRLNAAPGMAELTLFNKINIFTEGNAKFDALLEDIAGARHSVFLQYYIMRNDALTRRIVQALAERARSGVRVCLLLDGMGCMLTPRSAYLPLIKAGGEVTVFMPFRLGGLNYRNHRKIALVDGHTGYIGGLNIGQEYLGLAKRFGFWRDAHIRIQGDAVRQLTLRFVMDWNFAHKGKPIDLREALPPTGDTPGLAAMQVICSGPDTDHPAIHYTYLKMITTARDQVLIQSPYFIPDDSVLEALRLAALSGVDVRIMIPAKPDHPFVYWAALSYLGELLESGVRCFEYRQGFLHSKVVVVDKRVASVGTANLDVRSFKLNFEINAVIYNEELATELVNQFYSDALGCTEITLDKYTQRSGVVRIKEAVSRLLSPIL